MEAAGIEPASASPSATASTCVVRDRVSSREGSRTTPYETSRVRGSRRALVTRGSRRAWATSPIRRRPSGGPRAGISRGRATQIYAARAKPSLAPEGFPVFNEAPGTSARFRSFRFTRRSRVAPRYARILPTRWFILACGASSGSGRGGSLTAGNRRGYTRSLPGPAESVPVDSICAPRSRGGEIDPSAAS